MLARIKEPVLHAEFMMLANRILADPTIQFPPAVWIRLAATQPGSHHLYPQGEIGHRVHRRGHRPLPYRAYAGQAARRGRRYKTNVWVSSDGSRVATLLLNGRAANQATGDMRPEQALAELYCPA